MKSSPKSFSSHFPKSKKEEAEFGKGRKDIIVCPKCESCYFYKSWHHRLSDYPEISEKKNLKFALCPACRMIADRKYEGEVIIENIPKTLKKDIINTIKNVGKIAFERDTQDRIISISNVNSPKIRVLTTENQLSVRIGKKIKSAFNAKMKIQYSEKESTTRVKISF